MPQRDMIEQLQEVKRGLEYLLEIIDLKISERKYKGNDKKKKGKRSSNLHARLLEELLKQAVDFEIKALDHQIEIHAARVAALFMAKISMHADSSSQTKRNTGGAEPLSSTESYRRASLFPEPMKVEFDGQDSFLDFSDFDRSQKRING
jgi:hypothetical protein